MTASATNVIVGLFIAMVLTRLTSSGQRSSFGLAGQPGDKERHLSLPTTTTLLVVGAMCVVVGVAQAVVHLRRRRISGSTLGNGNQTDGVSTGASPVNILVAVVATFAAVVWATRGAEFSAVGMFQTSVSRATPLALGAMAGILCERSGVVNIAIEAMMIFAAFGGAVGASVTGSLWVGLLVGLLAGACVAYFHAGLSITFGVDQIISGTVLNIVALGITSFIAGSLLRSYPNLNNAGTFAQIQIPGLARIPFVGPVLFQQNIFVYLMYLLVPLLGWSLSHTRWGLRVRAVGEHPGAADSVGIDVRSVRFRSVVLGGAMAGLAGSFLSLGSLGSFEAGMTAGRGFIALAAMIIGRWKPAGAFGAALLFGFAEALQTKLAIISAPIPSQFLLMTPYVVTLLVVAGFVGRTNPPAADGVPYPAD